MSNCELKQEAGAPHDSLKKGRAKLVSLWPALLLVGAVLVADLNVLSAGFVWDDGALIGSSLRIQSWSSLTSVFSSTFLTSYYRPVVLASFAAEHALWGAHPFGYHLTNLFLHALNVLLVFFLMKRITGNRIAAFLGSFLFAVHPAHKGVVFISDRTGMLAAFFFLASLLFHMNYRESETGLRRGSWYAAAVAFFGLAAFSKEEALTLPLVLILTDHFFYSSSLKRNLPRTLALYLPFFFIIGIYLSARAAVVDLPVGIVDGFFISPLRRVLTVPSIMLRFLRVLAFPLQLDYDPRVPLIGSVADMRAWLGISAFIFSLAAAFYAFKRNRVVIYGILWFLVVFVPMSNIIPVRLDLAESELFTPVHFLYLPSIGIFLGVGAGLQTFFHFAHERRKQFQKAAAQCVLILIGISFCVLSIRRNIIWKDGIRLFGYMASMHPERAHVNLAEAYRSAGEIGKAIRVYQKAATVEPGCSEVHNGLGVAYLDAGMIEAAMREFKKSIEADSDNANAYANLAVAFVQKGLLQKALVANQKAVELKPSMLSFRTNLGLILMKLGKFERAEEQFLFVLAADPKDAQTLSALAQLQAQKNIGNHAYQKKPLQPPVPAPHPKLENGSTEEKETLEGAAS
jgi:tetratricopeptide (TPR) repeat protein